MKPNQTGTEWQHTMNQTFKLPLSCVILVILVYVRCKVWGVFEGGGGGYNEWVFLLYSPFYNSNVLTCSTKQHSPLITV